MRCRSKAGARSAKSKERQQHQRSRPGEGRERDDHRRRHENRDHRRRHGVRVEKLDRLHVLRRERDKVARAAAQQIGRRQRIELAEERDPHLGEELIGHVVRLQGFQPGKNARERRHDGKADKETAVRMAVLKRGDDEGAEDGDADIGGDAARSGQDDERQPPPPRRDEAEKRFRRAAPIHPLDAQDRILALPPSPCAGRSAASACAAGLCGRSGTILSPRSSACPPINRR